MDYTANLLEVCGSLIQLFEFQRTRWCHLECTSQSINGIPRSEGRTKTMWWGWGRLMLLIIVEWESLPSFLAPQLPCRLCARVSLARTEHKALLVQVVPKNSAASEAVKSFGLSNSMQQNWLVPPVSSSTAHCPVWVTLAGLVGALPITVLCWQLDASHGGLGFIRVRPEAEGRLNHCQRGRLGTWARRGSQERSSEISEWEGKGHLRSLHSVKLGARSYHSS